MRNIVMICSLLLATASVSAQITFWGTSRTNMYDAETQTWIEDTIISFVADQYDYNEIDLISTIQEEWGDEEGSYPVNYFCLWKNGQKVNENQIYSGLKMYIRDESLESHRYNVVGIDSIVWHPYRLNDAILAVEKDTMPVVELYGSNTTRTYSIRLEPHYATYSCGLSISDPSIVDASIEKFTTGKSSMYYTNELVLTVTPKAVGTTILTLNFNNSINRQMEIVVNPTQEVRDETGISVDSLFNKIYSRLVLTGNVLPAGDPDWKDLDEGLMGFSRILFSLQEFGADQVYWIWSDPGITDVTKNQVDAQNLLVEALFHRLYYNIWLCNSYLNRTQNQAELTMKRAEVRFLRAYFYYYLLDMFGNVPIVTDNTTFTTTAQSTRQQLYDFVEAELLAAEPDLATVGYKEDYYRVDKAAAWLLLSRLYLNAPVYYSAYNEYDKAALYASKVIQSSYDLATNYRWLFMGDNDINSNYNDAWKEMIFTIRQEGADTKSWSGSVFQVASMSSYTMPSTGCQNSWECIRSRGELVDLFFADPSVAEGTANDLTQAAQDDRARFCNSYNGMTWNYRGNSGYGSEFTKGWAIQKWSNWYADSGDSLSLGSSPEWPDTDIPLMRKAEAYLNYAEAVLRGGAQVGDLTAVEAVNVVRRRAHASEVQSVSLDYILDERGREFYAEGYRRTDLIRFGKFGGNTGYQWEGKSGVKNGADFPQYMNLYPIPTRLLQAMYQGVQNPGY